MKTTDARLLPAAAQEDLRRKAVNAVGRGQSISQASRLLGVSRQAVYTWLACYQQGGAAALAARQRGRRPGRDLHADQAQRLRRKICDRCPDQLKLPFALWTREAVQELIRRECGLHVSVWTVGRDLRDWGMSPQKPARRAYERDPRAVARWMKEEYPAIAAWAKRENAEILWEDEMGLRSDQVAGRSYAPLGRTPVIPITGNRFGCNMMSAISNRGKLYFMVFRGGLRTPVFLDFLKRLIRQVPRTIALIVDGYSVHRSAAARNWLANHAERIRLFFLPPYSPELNPDEYLNQDVKSNALKHQRPHNAEQMTQAVRRYLRSTQRQPHLVARYFHAEPVRYAALG